MVLDVFGGLFALLGFLLINLVAGIFVTQVDFDLPTMLNNLASLLGGTSA